jgi:hypothetical protein
MAGKAMNLFTIFAERKSVEQLEEGTDFAPKFDDMSNFTDKEK